MGLNVSRHRHRLPLEASILFLVLTIATKGVDLVAQGEASIPSGLYGLYCWLCFDSGLLDCVAGLCWFCVRRSCCWVCFFGFLLVGCVDCVAGFVRFRVAGLCGLCCWVVLISGASILLLGLFFWFSAGGLCGFRCDTGVDYGCRSVAVWVKK